MVNSVLSGYLGCMINAEVPTGDAKTLLQKYAADWASMPVSSIASPGIDNALFRLGGLPLVSWTPRPAASLLVSKRASCSRSEVA